MKTAEAVTSEAREVAADYGRPMEELRGFTGVMAVYIAGMSAITWGLRRNGQLPRRFATGDLALVALATHKLSRTMSKDSVTSPLRAPFARLEGAGPPGEVNEKVVGRGARKAVGELVTCPFCLDQWIASGFMVGLAAAPRVTRFAASILAVRAGADLLQFGYAAADQAVD